MKINRFFMVLGIFLVVSILSPADNSLAGPYMYVTGHKGKQGVLRFDADTGEYIDHFASGHGLTSPTGLDFGPDGNLYVVDFFSDRIYRFDGETGEFMDFFVSTNLHWGQDLKFGPDGNLYVISYSDGTVLRYNGTTGEFMDVFASGGGLDGPWSFAFGPDGNLYVCGVGNKGVFRYDGTTGQFIDIFISDGSSTGMDIGPDGNLYINNYGDIRVYDITSGALVKTISSSGRQRWAFGVGFGPGPKAM